MRKIKNKNRKLTPFTIIKQYGYTYNEIGEKEIKWVDAFDFEGVLSLQSGDSKYSSFNAKIEESTHILTCDYHNGIYSLGKNNTRIRAKGMIYDVLLIDNPDELDVQLEIYLRFVGGKNG